MHGRKAEASRPPIVEVLSPSTEEYDRGDRFEHYKRISALRQYVLVSHHEREIEVWSRSLGDDWTRVVARANGRVALESIGAELAVDEVYDAVAEPLSPPSWAASPRTRLGLPRRLRAWLDRGRGGRLL